MPRKPRLDIPGALHHVIVRGRERSRIFRSNKDRAAFIDRLGDLVLEDKATVYAWALLDNHVHILLKSGKKGLSSLMRKLLTGYAVFFNKKYHRSGHLFQNRYKSILCEEDSYLLTLVRYIHLNPVRLGTTDLDHYPWTGHRALIGETSYPWMGTEYVLSYFGATQQKAVRAYRKFVVDGADMGHRPELTGGGLVRSIGERFQVLAMRRAGEKAISDERILGTNDFVHNIFKELAKAIPLKGTIDTIIKEECRAGQVSTGELQSGSRRRNVASTRAIIAQRALRELGISAAEIARHLGVNTSSITRAVEKREREGMT